MPGSLLRLWVGAARPIAPVAGAGTMAAMQTDYVIALDNAQAHLGDLYILARRFAALRDAADAELLPAITEIGMRLRRWRRQDELSQDRIAATAAEMHALQDRWQQRIAALRATPLFSAAHAAFEANDQAELGKLLPRIVAALSVVPPPPRLHFGIRVSAPRRGPGAPPFIDSAACVDRIIERLGSGLRPAADDALGFPHLPTTDDPGNLDSPVSLVLTESDSMPTVFRNDDDMQLLVHTPHLAAAFVPALCRSFDDPWWQTNDETYPEFRERVAAGLRSRGHEVLDVGDDDARR